MVNPVTGSLPCWPNQYPDPAAPIVSARTSVTKISVLPNLCCNTAVRIKDFTTLLAPKARETIHLNRQLRQAVATVLPAAAIDAVALCRIDENQQFHVTLTSASWLSRLRFSEKKLIAAVADLNLTVTRVRWHVLPGRVEPQRRGSVRMAALEIPSDAPAKLHSAADQFSEAILRNALKQVARTMQTRLDEKRAAIKDKPPQN